jgi:hypothetical protein
MKVAKAIERTVEVQKEVDDSKRFKFEQSIFSLRGWYEWEYI